MTVFKDYSQFYDLLYADKDYAGEVAYLHDLIHSESRDAKTILNLGCGTGKHDALLAEKGYHITAVDLSETMIDIAKQNFGQLTNIEFKTGDLRTYRDAKRYDVVLSLFHVMSYQVNDSDLKAALETAQSHLKPGGLFIFDFWNGPGVLSDPPHNRVKEVENESLKIHRRTRATMDQSVNRVDVHFDIQVENKVTREQHQLEETHAMRYLFQSEIKELADEMGFEVRRAYKWMTHDRPKEEDWYVVNLLR